MNSRARVNDDCRKRVITAVVENGLSLDIVAQSQGLSKSTVKSIIRTFRRTNSLESLRKTSNGRKSMYNDEHISFIRRIFERNSTTTIQTVCNTFNDAFPELPIKRMTMNRILKKINFTRKNVSQVPQERNGDETKRTRKEFAMTMLEMIGNDEGAYKD